MKENETIKKVLAMNMFVVVIVYMCLVSGAFADAYMNSGGNLYHLSSTGITQLGSSGSFGGGSNMLVGAGDGTAFVKLGSGSAAPGHVYHLAPTGMVHVADTGDFAGIFVCAGAGSAYLKDSVGATYHVASTGLTKIATHNNFGGDDNAMLVGAGDGTAYIKPATGPVPGNVYQLTSTGVANLGDYGDVGAGMLVGAGVGSAYLKLSGGITYHVASNGLTKMSSNNEFGGDDNAMLVGAGDGTGYIKPVTGPVPGYVYQLTSTGVANFGSYGDAGAGMFVGAGAGSAYLKLSSGIVHHFDSSGGANIFSAGGADDALMVGAGDGSLFIKTGTGSGAPGYIYHLTSAGSTRISNGSLGVTGGLMVAGGNGDAYLQTAAGNVYHVLTTTGAMTHFGMYVVADSLIGAGLTPPPLPPEGTLIVIQ